MAAQNRAGKVRAAAVTLTAKYSTKFDATFDRGAHWDLQWVDGPTSSTVEKQLSKLDVAGAEVRLHRNYSTVATAIAVIRAAAGGENVRSLRLNSWSSTDIIWKLDSVEHPERPSDPREQRMVTALLAAATPPNGRWADESKILELVSTRGLAWLLGEETSDTSTAPGAGSGSPIEVLTARFATGEAKWRWERQAIAMPARDAIDAALADPELDQPGAMALLRLLAQVRAEQSAAETRAIAIARSTEATWDQIADAAGLTKEQAQSRQDR